MGLAAPPYYGKKKSKFYENKILKAQKKIDKLQKIIAECQKQIDNAKSKN